MKKIRLNDELEIPIIGFGTWQITEEEAYESVKLALEVGYRHIDTADGYGNHKEVGQALKDSGIKREDIFLTTKVRPFNLHAEDVIKSGERFLEELQVDYIDLLLIHWPNKEIPIEETLQAFDQLKKRGIIKSIGVSNFTKRHIEEALKTGVEIVNNQVEIHPTFAQFDLVTFCQDKGITLSAYSPIGHGNDLDIPEIVTLSQKHNATPAQIILAWLMSRDLIVLPKSVTKSRIEENFKSLDLILEPGDIETMNGLTQGERIGKPAHAEFD